MAVSIYASNVDSFEMINEDANYPITSSFKHQSMLLYYFLADNIKIFFKCIDKGPLHLRGYKHYLTLQFFPMTNIKAYSVYLLFLL